MVVKIASLSPAGTDQRKTVSTTVVQLDPIGHPATHVFLDVQGADLMVTFDDSDPSAVNGHRFAVGASAVWNRATAKAAKFIRQGATDGVVHVSPMS